MTLLIVVSLTANSQANTKGDSINLKLLSKTGVDRWNYLVEQTLQLADKNNAKALFLIEEAERSALNFGDSSCLVMCQRMRGQILFRLGKHREAVGIFDQALPVARRHRYAYEELAIVVALGISRSYSSEYDHALKDFFEAYQMSKDLQDTAYWALTQNNIGVIYYKLKDYGRALHYWKEAIESERSMGVHSYFKMINVSLAYANLGDFENAGNALSESIRICGEECPDAAMIHIKYASGTIHMGLKNAVLAEQDFLSSYQYSKKTANDRMMLDNIYMLADIYHERRQTFKALQYLDEGDSIIRKGIPFNLEVIKIYQRFSQLYMHIKNYEKAARYQSKYITLKDSIYNEGLTTRLMEAESEQLAKLEKLKVESQKEIIFLQEEALNRQNKMNMLAAIASIGIMGFSVMLYKSYRQKINLNKFLDRKIQERTLELESSRGELLKQLRQRELVAKRTSAVVLEKMFTLRGLSMTAREELSDPTAKLYFAKMENMANQVDAYVRSFS